ncbi:MAG: hypothetical protein JW884_09515 [Deltaproteobacteria bacterium]|nr:hypothetical protein [Deltaproteobacteria bacterium]
MSRIVIGIHGLGNKPPKQVLRKHWKRSLYDGFRMLGHPWKPFRFEMVYWADLMNPLPYDPAEGDRKSPLYDDEPYVPPSTMNHEKPSMIRKKVVEFLEREMTSIFLNSDLSVNFDAVTSRIIRHYFRELDMYYCANCTVGRKSGVYVKDVLRERLIRILQRYRRQKILLIGHSMGSIIAYDALSLASPDIEVDTFITIGSPLGVPVVISKIAGEQQQKRNLEHMEKPRVPEAVTGAWLNFSDIEDNMTVNYRLSNDFAKNSKGIEIVDTVVSNEYAYEGKPNPHKAYGYLRTPEVARAVLSFIARPEKDRLRLTA